MCIQAGNLLLLAAVPEARSSFFLVFSVAGTHRNASSQNKAYTTCIASAPFLQAVTFPRAEDSPQLVTHILPFL